MHNGDKKPFVFHNKGRVLHSDFKNLTVRSNKRFLFDNHHYSKTLRSKLLLPLRTLIPLCATPVQLDTTIYKIHGHWAFRIFSILF